MGILRNVRDAGVLGTARGLVPFGHLCWAYADRAELLARAAEYLADGVAAGQWVEYVGAASADALSEELAGLPGGQAALDAGHAEVSSVRDFYRFVDGSDVVDAKAAVEARVSATEQALQRGFSGFRAVVDATAVVRDPVQREAFARFECLIDRKMSVLPVSAVCAYDARQLGIQAVSEMACLHPFVNDGYTPFRLYAEQGVHFALAGEIDLSCEALFDTTLGRTIPLCPEPVVAIDGHQLEFIDHRALRALGLHGQQRGRQVLLRTRSPSIARVAQLLELPAVQVEVDSP